MSHAPVEGLGFVASFGQLRVWFDVLYAQAILVPFKQAVPATELIDERVEQYEARFVPAWTVPQLDAVHELAGE